MMLTQAIQEKIRELFNATPNDIGVSYGKKMTNGEFTGQLGIVFHVGKKLPLEAIDEGQLLPSSVIIDDVEYLTDVIEVGEIKAAVDCDNTTLNNCYGWKTTNPGNQLTVRPLKGGISILSSFNSPARGTLGFIAVDTETQALVGVSNNHVLNNSNYYTIDRDLSLILQNELSDNVYQTGETFGNDPALIIGKVLRYVPLSLDGDNQVDGALVSVSANDISNTESFKQYGVNYNSPLPFATTAEINNLLVTNPPLYSSGRTSGAKGDAPCGLIVSALGVQINVSGYKNQAPGDWLAYFTNIIAFTRSNPNCPNPVSAGDSGSALVADFNGVRKIIGLVFATGDFTSYACRIDDVAAQLGISAWDGTPKNYINLNSQEYKTTPGGSANKLLNCDGKTYWQVGLIGALAPCIPTTTTTSTIVPTTTTTTTQVGPLPTTTTTTTTPPIEGIYTLYQGFKPVNTTWITFN